MLNGHYDKHGGKRGARYSRRTVLTLAAVVASTWWLLVVYKRSHPSPSHGRAKAWSLGSLLGLGSSASSSETARPPDFSGLNAKEEGGHEQKSSRHKRRKKKKSSECTSSPLEEKEAFPIYGCQEMDVRASERERERDKKRERRRGKKGGRNRSYRLGRRRSLVAFAVKRGLLWGLLQPGCWGFIKIRSVFVCGTTEL